jgi:hypothetical protein
MNAVNMMSSLSKREQMRRNTGPDQRSKGGLARSGEVRLE